MSKKIFGFIKIGLFVGLAIFYFVKVIKSDVVINDYSAVVTVNTSGDMTVVETWDMTYNQEMRVRFRDIVYDKYADGYPLPMSSSNTASFNTYNVHAQFFKDGVDKTNLIRFATSDSGELDELGYPIVCEPNVSNCESLFIDTHNAGGLDGDVTFVYTYTIVGAVTQYSDISELNWRLFEYAESTVKSARIEINLPNNAYDTDALMVWGHGLSNGSIEIISNQQIVLSMKNIKPGEFPEFRVLAENSLFPYVDQDNKFISSQINKSLIVAYEDVLTAETNARIAIANTVLFGTIAMFGVMVVITYFVYKKYDKEYEPDFKGDYFRELPSQDSPALVSYLTYMRKITDEVVPATLLDLIRRKYIILDYSGADMSSKHSNFTFTLNQEMDQTKILSHERSFLNWIFKIVGNGQVVSSRQIEDFGIGNVDKAKKFQAAAKQFVRFAEKDAEKKKFFETGFELKKSKVMIAILLPIVSLLIAFYTANVYSLNNWIAIIISCTTILGYTVYVKTIKKRSVSGNELFTKWMAFKNFLLDFSNMDDYPIPGIIVWEHYLVYATVFKIADKVSSQLSVKLPAEEFESQDSTYMRTSHYRRGLYYNSLVSNVHTSFSIAKMNSASTIVSANVSKFGSSGGSGGGFGGGSSFGGGGGGGRSR